MQIGHAHPKLRLPVLLLALLSACTAHPPAAPAPRLTAQAVSTPITVYPAESAEYLKNPGKGWIAYGDNVSIGLNKANPFSQVSNAVWSKASTGYVRFHWSQLEPSDNAFDWSYIDNAISVCAAHGVKFAFGIMYANDGQQASPLWLFNAAGAASVTVQGAKAPVWSDPVFLAQSAAFVTALKNRYNGNPNIAYIDARNYGNWGEWYDNLGANTSEATKRQLIDQWAGFDKTPIIVPISGGNGLGAGEYGQYARDTYGFGLREDSSDYSPRFSTAASALNIAPAVAEFSWPYGGLKLGQGWTGEVFYDGMISGSILGSKYSWYNLGQWGTDGALFLGDKPALVDTWQNKMGYWFKVSEATYPQDLGNGSTQTVSFKVRNDGVAPIYVNWNKNNTPTTYVRLALLDANGNVLARSGVLPGINPFDWKPGQTVSSSASFAFPATSGATQLALGVFSDAARNDPDIRFANAARLPSGWLPLSGGGSGGNRISNGGFEADLGATQSPTGWTEGNAVDAVYTEPNAPHSGSYNLAFYKASPYTGFVYQTLTNLANGSYTLSAWVRSSGGQTSAYMFAAGYGGAELKANIPAGNSYTQISLPVNVSNGQVQIGFYSEAGAGNWITVDDVSLSQP